MKTKRVCEMCGLQKVAVPCEPPRKDRRRHSQDENGKTWYAGFCPPCARDYRYDQYRAWLERKALRLGRRFPREGVRKVLGMLLALVLISACGDIVPPPVDVNYVGGTWTLSSAFDSLQAGQVKEVWTFTSSQVQVDRYNLPSGAVLDSHTYTWEKIETGHLIFDGTIDVRTREIGPTCFVLESMTGRAYYTSTNFIRPQ